MLETAGLTYAEYARSGLLPAAGGGAITLFVLLGVQAATEVEDATVRWRVLVLAEVAVALTLVVVSVELVAGGRGNGPRAVCSAPVAHRN